MAEAPVVLTLVVPVKVAPPVAVKIPPKVSLSQSVAVVRVEEALSLFQYPTVPSLLPVISPVQERSPDELVTVQPVAETPPASSTFPVEVLPIWTKPVVPASSVKLVVSPVEIAPAPAKPKAVADTEMVSILATPVKAPPVVTLRPPLEVRANVPLAFPIEVLPDIDERVVVPQEVRSVKVAVPGAEVPMDTKLAAPVALMFHCPSVIETSAPVFPRVRAPE